jgi:hypothetical protein
MSNVLVINDTSSEFHIGCLGVMKTIYDDVKQRWPDCKVDAVTTHDIKQAGCVRDLVQSVGMPDFVVVNGEGSMHQGNKEGEFIIGMVQELFNKGVGEFYLLNTSMYSVPESWVGALGLFSVIQVRDLRSAKVINDAGLLCTFLPDRLFRFVLETFPLNNEKSRGRGVLYFDAVNRSHEELLSIGAIEGREAMYGAVDCSPFLTARVLGLAKGIFRYDLRQVVRFYLKVLRRSVVYRGLYGRKYIYSLDFPVVTPRGEIVDVCAARYHIAVMCFALCIDGKFLTSNTPKIEALVDYMSDVFAQYMSVQRSEEGFLSVLWKPGGDKQVRGWIESFDYGWW